MDVNGDGKMDLVRRWRQVPNAAAAVWLSNGTGFTNVSNTVIGGWCTGQTAGDCAVAELPMDIDGDGKTDIVRRVRSGSNAVTQVWLSSGPAPDRLSRVNTGVGGATLISYRPSTYYVNTQLPFPVQTVEGVTTCSNWNGTSCVGQSSPTIYLYDGGFHNFQYRDFRGFSHVRVRGEGVVMQQVGSSGTAQAPITETWFHQGTNPNKSADTLADLQSAPIAWMAGKPWKTDVKVAHITFGSDYSTESEELRMRTETGYHNILGGTSAPFFPKVLNVTTQTCLVTCTKQTLSEFSYHFTGALTHEFLSGDTSTASDNRTVIHTLSSNTTDWILNVPIKDEVYRGIAYLGDTPVLMAQTDFYYDGTTSCGTASTNQIPTKGHLTRTVRAFFNGTSTHAAPETRMAYNSYGSIICARDANGNASTITYDSATNTFPLTNTTASPASLTTTTSYYGVNGVAIPATGFYGQVQSVTDPNGRVTTHEYDALGRRTKTTNPDGFLATTTYNYGAGQTVGTQHVLTTNSLGHSSATYFDGLGQNIRTTSTYTAGPTRETQTLYNSRGLVQYKSLPYFTGGTVYWQTITYDGLDRVWRVTNPDNTVSQSCYGDWTTVTIEPDGDRKRETRDAFGRVIKIEEYNTTFATCDATVGAPYATTNYIYDVLGNLLSVTDAKGNVSTMAYDSLSRKKSMHDPDLGDWSYLYDANGNLTKQTDAKGQVIWFTYDSLNRRVQKDFGGTAPKALGSGDVRYTYDDTVPTTNRKGRLKQVVDAATNVTFEYDTMGRVSKSSKVLDGTTYVTTSAYDGLGRLTSVVYPNTPASTVSYEYENNGPYLKRVYAGTTTYVQYAGWNEMGQPATATYNVGTNQVTTTYTYQTASNATCSNKHTFRPCTTKVQKGTSPAYLDLRYVFTNGGNVKDIFDQITPANNQSFIYDALDRLTSANGPYGASNANATWLYTYDQIGNMTSNPQVGAYAYPASGPSSVRPHAVTTAGPYPITYDNNGNIATMTDPTGFFGYNASFNTANRLSSVTTLYAGTPTTSTFVYDGDGGRVKKTVGATTTRYISKLYECDTTGTSTSCSRFIFVGNTRVATVASNGTTHFWHQDHLGSSTVITDSTGARVQALAYYPYGDLRINQSFTTPAVNVPHKYTGKELDTSSNLYFFESRYYHAVFGRFVSPDTIVPDLRDPQTLNRYAYAKNNPLLYTDPTGHFAFIPFVIGVAVSATISAAVSTVMNVAIAATTGGNLADAAKAGAVSGAIAGGLCPGGCGPIGGIIAYSAAGAASAAAIGQDPGRGAMYGAAMGATLSVMPNIGFQPFGNSATNWVANYANQVLNDSLKGAVFGATAAGIQGQDIGQGAWAGALASAGGRQFSNLVGHGVGFASSGFRAPTYSDGAFAYPCGWCGGAITFGNVVTINEKFHGALFDANVRPNARLMNMATDVYHHELGHVGQYARYGISFFGIYGAQIPFVALTGHDPFQYNLLEYHDLGGAMTSGEIHDAKY